ncbi:PSMF1-like protein [Mya arenaria]|uniref:Proteasome inhibitor PI31 subunit n=1 Tax=Mya arenaria TaxID=6604 RepID=A0ABY7F9R2_MYAAR|nr:PSMF1-like protein [Mya arenaria]
MASAGMELMFNSVKSTLRSPQDGIICVLHWKIISSGFQCIGIGEKAGKNDPEEETEMLPDGWNMTPDLYVLRYRSERGVYVLKKDREDQRVATMNIRIADFATEDLSSYKKQDPDDPFSIGRGDLDPLRSGGGMLFDPMRGGRGPRFGMDPSAGLPSRLPRGAVPPGARFDPFGPPGTHPGQRPGPDPDHMRPPDYDDMFM